MKNKFLSLLLLILTFLPVLGQINREGFPFVRYFDPSEMKVADQNWSATRDQRGVMYFANMDNGVLEYDGVSWRAHPLPGNVNTHVVFVDSRGILYAGGDREFGYFQPDRTGNLQFHSLVEKLDSAGRQFITIYTINEWKGNIVFASTEYFYLFDPVKDTIRWVDIKNDGFQHGNYSFVVEDHYFHGEYAEGLLEFDGKHFKKVKNGGAFSLKAILSVLPYSDDEVIVLTYRSGVYGYNLKTGAVNPNIFSQKANEFLKTNQFFRGQVLPDGSYALGTLGAGLIIVTKDGKVRQILGRDSGLGNITITNVFYDKNAPASSQLWLPLDIGIAKIEWFSPFRYFSETHGFKGSINDIKVFRGKLYLATSNGVFVREADDDGRAIFVPVPEINSQAWSFLTFTPPGSTGEHLWVGTIEGIYDITNPDRIRLIEEGIPNLTPRGRKFYVYKLYATRNYPYKVFIGTNKNLVILEYRAGRWYKKLAINDFSEEVRSIKTDIENNIWFSTIYSGLVKLNLLDSNRYDIAIYGAKKGLKLNSGNQVFFVNKQVYAGNDKGLFVYQPEQDLFRRDTTFLPAGSNESVGVSGFINFGGNRYFLCVNHPDGTNHVKMVLSENGKMTSVSLPFLRLPSRRADAFCAEGNLVWIGISNQLFSYNTGTKTDYNAGFKTLIRKITIGEDSVLFGGAYFAPSDINILPVSDIQPVNIIPDIKYALNNLTFHWSCPYFEAEDNIEYSYRLRGFDDNWSRWTNRTEFPFTNIPNGDFVFEVKARNIYGVEGSTGSFTFTVLPPWYLTVWAFILYIILAFMLIVIIVKLYTRRLQNEKIRLEGIVAERTAEVVRQKEELTDSIMYASRIQKAVLPAERLLNEQFPEHFILFKPRDIVSGDFYWMTQRKNKIFVSAADCTGHGVPGAFMSLLGISFLNEIVNKSEISQPGLILDELRTHVMTSLKQRGEEGETKDGMDMAICVIDRDAMTLKYAGAYNPMYYVRPLTNEEKKIISAGKEPDFPRGSIYDDKNVLIQISADKMPIGISAKDQQSFTTHELKLIPGHCIYLFSDGYVDQFGGEQNKKFMSRAFKRLILSIQDIPMKEQRKVLDQNLLEWMGANDQVDDIIVIGLKLN
ncbi:MAG: SpoIIE family protein phosphatase [Chlorobi bacterium]|nr:SpoIIE family protein phosphatase [Chlorobiota bacterium]